MRTGCLNPCDLVPTVVVQSGATWYGGVGKAAVDRIEAEHVEEGEIEQEYSCVPRIAERQGSLGSVAGAHPETGVSVSLRLTVVLWDSNNWQALLRLLASC